MQRKQNIFQKFAVLVALVAFISAGYLAVNVATSCPAKAAICCNCFADAVGALSGAIASISSALNIPLIAAVEAIQSAFFDIAAFAFQESVVATVDEVMESVVSVQDTFYDYNIRPALQAQARQLNTVKASHAAQRTAYMDAAKVHRTSTALQKAEVRDHRELRPGENTCVAGTVTGGMARVNSFKRAYNAAAPAERAGRSGNAAGTPGAAGPAADMRERWNVYVTRYCKKKDNNGASGCTTDQAFADADVDIAGTILMKDTIDMKGNPDEKKNVDDLITHITEPFVKAPVPGSAVNSAPGTEAMLAGESYKTRHQTIYDSLYHAVARRAPGSGMADVTGPLRAAAGIAPGMISDNPSHHEIMHAMMNERFRSGKYEISQIDELENNEREMIIQHAFQLMQMSDQLDLMDRYALMLAAYAGAQIKTATPVGTAMEGTSLR